MTITQSIILADDIQSNGSRRILEEHTDHLGTKYRRTRKAQAEENALETAQAYASSMNYTLSKKEELKALVTVVRRGANPLTIGLNHITRAEFLKAIFRYCMKSEDVKITLLLKPVIDYLEANYTLTQIANYLSVFPEVLLRIRRRVNALYAVQATLNADTPEEIE